MAVSAWQQLSASLKMRLRMHRLISSLIWLCALSTFTGCGGTSVFPQPSAKAQLTVSPATMSFGSIHVGSTKTLTGTLKASGADVVVSTADWRGSGYDLSGISFPAKIAEGQKISFKVTFTPPATGVANGSLSFFTDASVTPESQALTGSGSPHVVSLSWSPSSSAVAGYNVYRGTQPGGPYSKINSFLLSAITYDDATVESGLTYFYVLRAVSPTLLESAASNQATATVP